MLSRETSSNNASITFCAAGRTHFGDANLAGRSILTGGLGGMGGAQPLAGRDVWAGFRHLERTVTIHRGAAAAGEAETINNRATHLLCVSLLYLLYYYRRTIWGRRAVG